MVLPTNIPIAIIGGNMSQSFRLRDPSWTLPKYKRGVGITLFHKDREAIAEDAKVGDIFMVHDVQVCAWVGRREGGRERMMNIDIALLGDKECRIHDADHK